jgi:hypothetical protein
LIYSNDMIQLRVVHNGVMFIATIWFEALKKLKVSWRMEE